MKKRTKQMIVFAASAFLIGLAVGGLAFGVQTAFAQQQANSSGLKDPKSRQVKRTDANGKPITVVDFEDANIEGAAKAPTGFVLQSRESASFRNLIELRRNFRPQIEASQLAVSVQ